MLTKRKHDYKNVFKTTLHFKQKETFSNNF